MITLTSDPENLFSNATRRIFVPRFVQSLHQVWRHRVTRNRSQRTNGQI